MSQMPKVIQITDEVIAAFVSVRDHGVERATAAKRIEMYPSTFNRNYSRWLESKKGGSQTEVAPRPAERKDGSEDQSTQGNDTENEQ